MTDSEMDDLPVSQVLLSVAGVEGVIRIDDTTVGRLEADVVEALRRIKMQSQTREP